MVSLEVTLRYNPPVLLRGRVSRGTSTPKGSGRTVTDNVRLTVKRIRLVIGGTCVVATKGGHLCQRVLTETGKLFISFICLRQLVYSLCFSLNPCVILVSGNVKKTPVNLVKIRLKKSQKYQVNYPLFYRYFLKSVNFHEVLIYLTGLHHCQDLYKFIY